MRKVGRARYCERRASPMLVMDPAASKECMHNKAPPGRLGGRRFWPRRRRRSDEGLEGWPGRRRWGGDEGLEGWSGRRWRFLGWRRWRFGAAPGEGGGARREALRWGRHQGGEAQAQCLQLHTAAHAGVHALRPTWVAWGCAGEGRPGGECGGSERSATGVGSATMCAVCAQLHAQPCTHAHRPTWVAWGWVALDWVAWGCVRRRREGGWAWTDWGRHATQRGTQSNA